MQTAYVERPGNPRLKYVLLEPDAPARAPVLVTTGFAEHTARYTHVVERWDAAGFVVALYDLRGHGESQGRPGHVERFHHYLDDAEALLTRLARYERWSQAGKPILFGHSLGALISTHLALREPGLVRGLGLSSPYFGRALKVPRWKLLAGRAATRIWPTFTQPTGIHGAILTHDAQRARSIDADRLSRQFVTARWFTEVERAQRYVLEHFERLSVPVFCLAAGDDLVADVTRTQRVFATSSRNHQRLKVLPGEYHELHHETNWQRYADEFCRAFIQWTQADTTLAPSDAEA